MKILIIGSGGREHALAWKAAQSPKVTKIFVAPGNAGTAREPKTENVAIKTEDIASLVDFARKNHIVLTIVGPETPLALGVVDAFNAAGLRCFGPTRAAAQLESSKAFAKDFLARHHIPTAGYGVFTDVEPALAYIRKLGAPLVIKADGLAAGKGVVIATSLTAADAAVTGMLNGNVFGVAGRRVVIEEFLQGEEASFIVLVDGEHILPLATTQDHKARDDGDRGPNTGGMGAYSPAPVVTPTVHARIMREIIEPTVRGMAAEGNPYTGFLYAGVMISPERAPRVLEFNCRLGDPETQPIMMRLRSDLIELCEAALDKRLDRVQAEWDTRAALGVVLAAGGYPGPYRTGDVIHGMIQTGDSDRKIFHAGTALRGDDIVTTGGRVACVCALGANVKEAQQRAYERVRSVSWEGMYYRTDIGYLAIAREEAAERSEG
jgi:phosphoribosylamine--glycine ligase